MNESFEILKYIKNVNSIVVSAVLEIYISSDNPGQNIVDKSTKLKNIGFLMEYLRVIFTNFGAQLLKCALKVVSWLLFHQFQAFQGFL